MPNRSPFSNPVFTRLFLAHSVSLAGTGITTIALALLAWDLAGDQAGKVLGTLLAIKMVAYVFLAPLAGSIAHRVSRKLWLVSLDILRAPLLLYLPFVDSVGEIYLILFLVSGCSAAFTPILQATIADLVKGEVQYQKALSYSRLAFDLEQLLSPAAAALLLTVMSFNGLFVLDACTFLISALFILSIAIPRIDNMAAREPVMSKLTLGVTGYLNTPRLRALLVLYVTIASVSAMMITGTVVYVGSVLNRGENYTAVAMAVSGGGSMVAALVLPTLLSRIPIRHALYGGALISVVGMVVAAYGISGTMFLVVWFILGAGLSLMQVPVGALVRMSCHKADLGAYFSANFSLSHLCWLGAYPTAGYASALFGINTAFLIMGSIAAVAAFISWRIYPVPDETVLVHTHEEMDHVHQHEHDTLHAHLQEEGEGNERHTHKAVTHKHRFVIDMHHRKWPH